MSLDELGLLYFHDGYPFLDLAEHTLLLDFHLLADSTVEVVLAFYLLRSYDESSLEFIFDLLYVVGEEEVSIADDFLAEGLDASAEVFMSLDHVIVELVCKAREVVSC